MKLRSELFSAKIRAGTVALWKNHDEPAFFGQVPF
jgi:hypothetical protein